MSKLIFIGDLEPYRQQIHTLRRRQYERLLEQADSYRTMELPAQHPKKSTIYMGIAILNLALAYRLSGEEKYLREARRFINTVLGYEKWGNAHLVNVDLSASWILFGLSVGYDWLCPALAPEERDRILTKIRHHARIIYEYRRRTCGSGWSTNFYQNHNWINMTGLAAAGYLLGEPAYTREAKEDMERVYSLLAEDGSNYEGVVYWRYGGMWLFVYAHLLKIQEGIDHFRTNPYLRNTFYYRLYQSCGDFSQQLNYGDCHDRHSGHPACVYYKAAAEYRDGYAQKMGDLVIREFLREEDELSQVKPGILLEAVFEFLWYDPTVEQRDFDDLPLTRYFPDLGLLSIRSSWQRDARVMTIKCGAPGGAKQWKEGWKIRRQERLPPRNLRWVRQRPLYGRGPGALPGRDFRRVPRSPGNAGSQPPAAHRRAEILGLCGCVHLRQQTPVRRGLQHRPGGPGREGRGCVPHGHRRYPVPGVFPSGGAAAPVSPGDRQHHDHPGKGQGLPDLYEHPGHRDRTALFLPGLF